MRKYRRHLRPHFVETRVDELVKLGEDRERLEGMDVDQYIDLYVKENMAWRQIDP
jgi:2-methylcitrate dehydratase